MNRTGLIVALVVAAVVGLVFGLYPQFDLRITRPFYEYIYASQDVVALRHMALWVPAILIIPSVLALPGKLVLPRRRMMIPGRAVLFLIVTLALGPGLLVNGLLKDHWGRPRPLHVIANNEPFVAWWDPRGDCPSNCSFVSGDVSGAFWTIAPAALAPPQWRAIAYGTALAFGTGMAVFRMMAGSHFFTDVVFSGVFTFLIIWFFYALIYRWPRTRSTDECIERVVARLFLTGKMTARRRGHRTAGRDDGDVANNADPHIRRQAPEMKVTTARGAVRQA